MHFINNFIAREIEQASPMENEREFQPLSFRVSVEKTRKTTSQACFRP